MRKCSPAQREDLWLTGGDATGMCVQCWGEHLEGIGAPGTPDAVSDFLGLPTLAPEAPGQRPQVADQRLMAKHEVEGDRLLVCNRCGHPHSGPAPGGHGTFLFDGHNRHIWSFDCVRAVVTPTGFAWD